MNGLCPCMPKLFPSPGALSIVQPMTNSCITGKVIQICVHLVENYTGVFAGGVACIAR